MSLESITLAATLSLAKPELADRPRVEAIAKAISSAVDSATSLPFEGPAAKEAPALADVAIGWHESGFREDIQTCKVTGDSGRSISLFQLMGPWARAGHSRSEVCASVELAASLALGVLGRHVRCSTHGAAFHGYASGSCGVKSKAGEELCRSWAKLATKAGLEASCDDRKPIRRRVEQ